VRAASRTARLKPASSVDATRAACQYNGTSSGVLGTTSTGGRQPGAAQSALRRDSPLLARALALAGAAFLAVYGWRALQRARQPQRLDAADASRGISRGAALAQAAAFTLLNPHVYLDTVLLVGSIGAQHAALLRPWFIAGASSASLCWFAGLGYGARKLAPLFARPRAWQVLDGLIGATMFLLAALLLARVLAY
jgi:L-lysine exporter family protein LysE/ArgO